MTERVLANSQTFEINTGVVKSENGLTSFAGMYTNEFVRWLAQPARYG